MLVVLGAAVRAKAQRFLVNQLLLFPSQEEPLGSKLGNRVDQADSVVDVVAVKDSNVLIRNQNVLIADLTNVWHLLDLILVELVLESWQAIGLNCYFFNLWLWVFYQEYEKILSFEIE